MQIFNRMTMGRAMLAGMVLAAVYYFMFLDSGATQKAAIAQAQAQIATAEPNRSPTITAKLDRAAVYKKTAAEIGSHHQ